MITFKDLLDITCDLLDEKRTNEALRIVLKPFVNAAYKEVFDMLDTSTTYTTTLTDYFVTLPTNIKEIEMVKIGDLSNPITLSRVFNFVIENGKLKLNVNSGDIEITYKPFYTPLINETDVANIKEEHKIVPCYYGASIYADIDDEYTKAHEFLRFYEHSLQDLKSERNSKYSSMNFINVW